MKFRVIIILFLVGIILTPVYSAEPSIALGFIRNASDDSSKNYLETVLSLSLASSMKKASQYTIIAPNDTRIKINTAGLSKILTPEEAENAALAASCDYFLYGYYIPLKGNELEITLNLYSNRSKHFFTFTHTEKLQAEISFIFDKILSVVTDFISNNETYMAHSISEKSGVAFITGLPSAELNQFYIPFMKSDYRVMLVQNNSYNVLLNSDTISAFYYITTEGMSFNSKRSLENTTGVDSTFKSQREQLFKSLNKSFQGQLDYLIIVGFDEAKKSAWIRGIDVKKQTLIMVQPGIKGKSIEEISEKIITIMTKGKN